MGQSPLHTGRIRLVPLSDEHLEHEVDLDSDPEVMRYLGNGRARTPEQVETLHQARLAAARRVPGLGFWAGFVDGEFVGWWILEPPERADQGPVDGQAELGYRILRRHWRNGLASEGARELLRHGFEDLGLTRIFAETMTVNAGSRDDDCCWHAARPDVPHRLGGGHLGHRTGRGRIRDLPRAVARSLTDQCAEAPVADRPPAHGGSDLRSPVEQVNGHVCSAVCDEVRGLQAGVPGSSPVEPSSSKAHSSAAADICRRRVADHPARQRSAARGVSSNRAGSSVKGAAIRWSVSSQR